MESEAADRRAVGRRLLGPTPVTMFFRTEILSRTIAELRDSAYQVVELVASRWLCIPDMHGDLARVLRFPGYYGRNLDAFSECLGDVIRHEYGFPDGATGLVIALTGFDEFAGEFPSEAHALLDIIAVVSRGALLAGEQLICLVQSNDPRFSLPPVGAIDLRWNEDEWFDSRRGLAGY